MLVQLKSQSYEVSISSLGAELRSFYHIENKLEYMWQANPLHWNRHAPILFPIVGALNQEKYSFAGKEYSLPRHGFARDSEFRLVNQDEQSVLFLLEDSEKTRKMYPFEFQLYIGYHLTDNSLEISYRVVNPSTNELFFSIGAHPAFALPIDQTSVFSDYELILEEKRDLVQIPLVDNLIEEDTEVHVSFVNSLELSHALFKEDALIFKSNTEQTHSWTLASKKSKHQVTLSYKGFPYVGIWSTYPKESNFVCIEPWYGIADTKQASGSLKEKLGIQRLASLEDFQSSYTITVK